jgi:hypothetical protein
MQSWQASEWQGVRARGKNAFLLRYGVVGRGLPLAVLCAVAIEGALGSPFPDVLWSAPFLLRFGLLVGVFSFSGCLRANLNWNLHEKRHASGA